MASAWLTYAWEDNKDRDVDFLAQELQAVGLTINLDRWNLHAGIPLWDQIAEHITNPNLSNAWLLIATQHSLGSEKCKEEFRYALDRALETRGSTFPVIAIFPSPVDRDLIPPAIRTRLYVSLTDSDWKERIAAAAEGRSPNIPQPAIEPYVVCVHPNILRAGTGERCHIIEVRPRAGTWAPMVVGVPLNEKALLIHVECGPSRMLIEGHWMSHLSDCESTDREWWLRAFANPATPAQSYFMFCERVPTKICFGVYNGSPQYWHALQVPGGST
jgi:hypothetical protein